jgi:hypothetical protein
MILPLSMKTHPARITLNALIAFLMLLPSCRKDESAELKAIREELQKSNQKLEDMRRNQKIEREGKARENQKSYFQ